MSVTDIITTLRPRQWLKNVVVFAPLVFAVVFFDVDAVRQSALAFFVLCLLSGAVYITNDVVDREEDRAHPTKCTRAIAAGRISVSQGVIVALLLLGLGLFFSFLINPSTLLVAACFLLVNALYTFGGKRVAILDVMLIGAGFVMRVLVGAVAIGVPASTWLLLTLFFLATYLGFTKRHAEYKLNAMAMGVSPTGYAIAFRVSLTAYTVAFLDHARSATLAVTLALYTLYTFSSPFGHLMALTVPFVFFGLMRYQAIVDSDTGKNDGPSDHIYHDRQLQIAIILWGMTICGIILLGGPL